jgi:hypothetical protein
MDQALKLNLSQALTLFEEHLPDIRKACVENIRALGQYEPLTDEEPYTKEVIARHVNYLVVKTKSSPMLNVIKRIDARKQHYSPTTERITDTDIERAREHPIQELWQTLVNTPIKGGMAECCFHDDSTASLSLRRHNRYHCFGCGEKGDAIDLYMKLNKVDFITAVKALR